MDMPPPSIRHFLEMFHPLSRICLMGVRQWGDVGVPWTVDVATHIRDPISVCLWGVLRSADISAVQQ